jgi:hypothetical protein
MPQVDRKRAIEACYLIPGWCFPMELGFIYDLVHGSRLHVELGSFCGRSMYAAVAAMAHGARAIAIDPLSYVLPSADFPLPSSHWPVAVWEATRDAMRAVRPDVTIEHVPKTSLDAARDFQLTIDSIYHDADHHYAELLGELEAWYPFVRSGGVVFGHDYWARDPGVIEAVHEFFGTRELSFDVLGQTRLWMHRKP